MKPSKSKTTGQTEKKSTKINEFFKSAPKEPTKAKKRDACIDNKLADSTKDFYIQALKDRLKHFNGEDESHTSDSSTNEVENLTSENNQEDGARGFTETSGISSKTPCDECDKNKVEAEKCEKKYKDLLKIHIKQSIRFAENEMKLNDVLTIAPQGTGTSEAEDVFSGDAIFTSSEIKSLKSISLDKGKDSTFVLQCIKFAYKANPSVLVDRTLQGKAEWTEIKTDGSKKLHPAKDPLTPDKVSHIKKLFVERIGRCKSNITSVEFAERIKEFSINKLFASGIKNLAKPFKDVSNGKENLHLNL